MKIVFKNGKEIEVNQVLVKAIATSLKNGTRQWKSFTNEKGEVFLIINMEEVAYIA